MSGPRMNCGHPGGLKARASVRFLTGLIRCGKCDGGMIGVSTREKGKKHFGYACLTRQREKRCDQDNVRADELEGIVLGDVKTLLRDDAFRPGVGGDESPARRAGPEARS
jgi:hypothetical protein